VSCRTIWIPISSRSLACWALRGIFLSLSKAPPHDQKRWAKVVFFLSAYHFNLFSLSPIAEK
jgi:hypothetical protein